MTDHESETDELLARLKQGDLGALADAFSRERERLARIVKFRLDSRLYGRVDADDILQEAYIAATERMGHYFEGPPMSPFLWLRLIVTQTMVDVHRRHLGAQIRDARREVSIHGQPYPQATTVSLAQHLAGNLTSPTQAVMREERLEQLRQALDTMDAVEREVLALRHFEELTNSEVAEVLEISQKAASMRYVRALKKLQDILSRIPGLQSGLDR